VRALEITENKDFFRESNVKLMAGRNTDVKANGKDCNVSSKFSDSHSSRRTGDTCHRDKPRQQNKCKGRLYRRISKQLYSPRYTRWTIYHSREMYPFRECRRHNGVTRYSYKIIHDKMIIRSKKT